MINEKNANTDKKRPEVKFNRFEILKKTPPPLVEKIIKSFNKKLSNKKNVKRKYSSHLKNFYFEESMKKYNNLYSELLS